MAAVDSNSVILRAEDKGHRLREGVRTMMRHWTGTWSDVEIREINKEVDFDGTEDPMDGTEARDWFTLLRYAIWHSNTMET